MPKTPRTAPATPYNQGLATIIQDISAKKKQSPLVAQSSTLGERAPAGTSLTGYEGASSLSPGDARYMPPQNDNRARHREATVSKPQDKSPEYIPIADTQAAYQAAEDRYDIAVTENELNVPSLANRSENGLLSNHPLPQGSRPDRQHMLERTVQQSEQASNAKTSPDNINATNLESRLVTSGIADSRFNRPAKRVKLMTNLSARADITLSDMLMAKDNAPTQDTALTEGVTGNQGTTVNLPSFFNLRELKAARAMPAADIHAVPLPVEKQATIMPIPAEDWTANTAVTNPQWFISASERQPHMQYPITSLASLDLCRVRPMLRGLESLKFDLFERNTKIQETDLVLSSRTAVMFRNLQHLPNEIDTTKRQIKAAAVYYRQVIVVFEVISYSVAEQNANQNIPTVNPLNPAVLSALSALKRAIAGAIVARAADEGVIGTVELVFALNGAGEIVKVLRIVAEEDADHTAGLLDPTLAGELLGDRDWLCQDTVRTDRWELGATDVAIDRGRVRVHQPTRHQQLLRTLPSSPFRLPRSAYRDTRRRRKSEVFGSDNRPRSHREPSLPSMSWLTSHRRESMTSLGQTSQHFKRLSSIRSVRRPPIYRPNMGNIGDQDDTLLTTLMSLDADQIAYYPYISHKKGQERARCMHRPYIKTHHPFLHLDVPAEIEERFAPCELCLRPGDSICELTIGMLFGFTAQRDAILASRAVSLR